MLRGKVFSAIGILICILSCQYVLGQHLYSPNPRLQQPRENNSAASRLMRQPGHKEMELARILSMARGGAWGDRSCNDTSGSFYYRKDSTVFYVGDMVPASDGSIMMCGQCSEISQNGGIYRNTDRGYLMKCDSAGNVKWIRLYDSVITKQFDYINYTKLTELRDGSWIMGGYTPASDGSYNTALIFTRTDAEGGIIWSKVFKSKLWTTGNGSGSYYDLRAIKQDVPGDGDVYVSGSHWSEGKNITRINTATGAIVWSRYYEPDVSFLFDKTVGLDIVGNEVLAFGTVLRMYSNSLITLQRIDKSTGDTIQTKAYGREPTEDGKLGILRQGPLVRLNNGNYAVYGSLHGSGYPASAEPYYQAGVVVINPKLEFVNAWSFRNYLEPNFYYSDMQMFPDGSGIFAMRTTLSGAASDIYSIQFQGMSILKQRRKHYEATWVGEGVNFLRYPDGSHLARRAISDSGVDYSARLEFLRMHISDTGSACLGVNDYSTWVEPYTLYDMPWRIKKMEGDDLVETVNKTLKSQPRELTVTHGCIQVSRCDSLRLTASTDTLCKGNDLLLTVHKNKECGASPFFEYETSVVRRFTQLSDSTFQVTFNSSWKGRIYAHMSGCQSYTDSVELVVLDSPDSLNLGADTAICPGNLVLLAAPAGFASYRWQDGSPDSFFRAEGPGTYHVLAYDGCGTFYRDTVVIAARASAPLSLGADREICRNDSLQFTVPADFITYSWSPAYNISSVSSSTATVRPLEDTVYMLKAEKPEGCFSFDTVRVFVKALPEIHLGTDTALCAGDSLILDAGAGFVSYQWNTGITSQTLPVAALGIYSVAATAANGCKTADTMSITAVFPLPVIELGNDSVICSGTQLVLHAGKFAEYKWNTGSDRESITVSAAGIHTVQVTDANGCQAFDTVTIKREVKPPAAFLPADTAICSYGTLQLAATQTYPAYRWSTGETKAAIELSRAGNYWLQVTDQYGCEGIDSVQVALKSCMEGFYIPSAFTPNNDGKNDLFKPLIFGNIEQYQFVVYNRWGQIVFSSSEPGKGWDGSITGQRQDMQVFVWICNFQLRGGGLVQKKGTVAILR